MTWVSRVLCDHSVVLAQEPTIGAYASSRSCGCTSGDQVGAWQVGIWAESAAEREWVRAAVQALAVTNARVLARAGEVAGAVAQLSRTDLPACTVLLSDGEYAAGLAWGGPLAMETLGPWEYALITTPDPGIDLLAPGTIIALDSCGPVTFPVPFAKELV